MALFQYFKQRDGLPDPKESLLLAIPSRAIGLFTVNCKVTEVATSDKKRWLYKKYSPEGGRCQIGHYICDKIELPQKQTKLCR